MLIVLEYRDHRTRVVLYFDERAIRVRCTFMNSTTPIHSIKKKSLKRHTFLRKKMYVSLSCILKRVHVDAKSK
jgi:hypothetical protein